jgi:hypothetical protein
MNRVCSIFNQLLQLFPRLEFEQAVARHRAERHARGFTCWGQFLAMLFCQIGQAKSLREICGGLASSEGKLQHLGLPEAPKRSTLAYANKHRPWQLFAEVFQQLQNKCGVQLEQRNQAGAKKFQFRHRLMSIDASLIFLCEKAIDWGGVSPWQRGAEDACAARPRGLSAAAGGDERTQPAGGDGGAQLAICPWNGAAGG